MSWLSPILLTRDNHSASLPAATAVAWEVPTLVAQAGLGSANAGHEWAWTVDPTSIATRQAMRYSGASVRPVRTPSRGASAVRAPVELLAKMSEAARSQGRSESDVWVEAAREWLRRRDGAETPPSAAPAYVAAPISPAPRMKRAWGDIDTVLQALRSPAHPDAERFPAA